jgi:hypothetical protein
MIDQDRLIGVIDAVIYQIKTTYQHPGHYRRGNVAGRVLAVIEPEVDWSPGGTAKLTKLIDDICSLVKLRMRGSVESEYSQRVETAITVAVEVVQASGSPLDPAAISAWIFRFLHADLIGVRGETRVKYKTEKLRGIVERVVRFFILHGVLCDATA